MLRKCVYYTHELMWHFILNNMQEFAKHFYKSKIWQQTSKDYSKSVHNLCEKCLMRGSITAGEIVHHKVHITPENIDDPNITLNWNNLELLCRDCHGEEHKKRIKRFTVDEQGRIIGR